jgi:hypothetical protein
MAYLYGDKSYGVHQKESYKPYSLQEEGAHVAAVAAAHVTVQLSAPGATLSTLHFSLQNKTTVKSSKNYTNSVVQKYRPLLKGTGSPYRFQPF